MSEQHGMPASRYPWRGPDRYRVLHTSLISGATVVRYFGYYQEARDFALGKWRGDCPAEVETKSCPNKSI